MNAPEDIDGLSECIGRAIQEHLAKSDINIALPQIDRLNHPILRFEAFLEDAGPSSAMVALPEKIASVSVLPCSQHNKHACEHRVPCCATLPWTVMALRRLLQL